MRRAAALKVAADECETPATGHGTDIFGDDMGSLDLAAVRSTVGEGKDIDNLEARGREGADRERAFSGAWPTG